MVPGPRTNVLRVDLSARRVTSTPIPERWRRRYIGGKGLGARYLYDELDPGIDPLGPENALLLFVGPLSGLLPGEPRYAAITRSPLTGTFLDSYAGGEFAGALAGSLDDHVGLIITGRADTPVRIVVEGGDARIEDTDQWGANTVETPRAHPDDAVACIGPAGEAAVAYATIASDAGTHHAGRGGAGAVMGSKHLKAVVACDDPPDPSTDPAIAPLHDAATDAFVDGDTGRWLDSSGTVETVEFADEVGVLAANGWQDTGVENVETVGVDAVRAAASDRERDGRIAGDFVVPTEDGKTVPRGATAMSLGAGLDIDDFDAVAALGDHCNRLGVDLISAGNAIALAIRAAEAGDIDRDLSFGDPAAATDLLHEIATRDSPLGDALANGVTEAAETIDTQQYVPVAKRLSLPGYDPREAPTMALAYATSDRGGCHRRARPVERAAFDREWSPAKTAGVVVAEQDRRALHWSLIADDFLEDAIDVADWLAAVDAPTDDLAQTGECIWTLVRLFNAREGFDRRDDALDRLPDDGQATNRLDAMLDAYYQHRGWNRHGLPTRETLADLDLTHLAPATGLRDD